MLDLLPKKIRTELDSFFERFKSFSLCVVLMDGTELYLYRNEESDRPLCSSTRASVHIYPIMISSRADKFALYVSA